MEPSRVSVQDNWANPSLIEAAIATWPTRDWDGWFTYEGSGKKCTKSPFAKRKYTSSPDYDFYWGENVPRACSLLLDAMSIRLAFDNPETGAVAFPDREWLHGAGLHEMRPGCHLGLHLDTTHHPVLPWRREYSTILYLDDCDSGDLDITEPDGTLIQRIQPRKNRLVMFPTIGTWHRVNETKQLRRSIVLFFWSVCSPSEQRDSVRAKFVNENER